MQEAQNVTRKQSTFWLKIIVLTLFSVIVSVAITSTALYFTVSGHPDGKIPEYIVWKHAVTLSAFIPAFICPIVVYALLRTYQKLDLAHAQLEAVAKRDPLTGLLNRRGFDSASADLVTQAVAARQTIAAMIFDIDRFKHINDTYGHDCGDVALCHLAKAIKQVLSPLPLAAIGRQGGDEFAVLLVNCAHETALGYAEEIRRLFATLPFQWQGKTLSLTTSIGLHMSALTDPQPSVRSMMSRADAALYAAKKHGRNRVEAA